MPNQPDIAPPSAFRDALSARRNDLRAQFLERPVELAERLGMKLPEKPVVAMDEQGLYDAERHGPKTPGLRDLVVDVCMGDVRSAAVVGPRGGGKALSVHTPIPTPQGWTAMGDLQPGDEVFDECGRVCRVVRAFPVMEGRPCYEITFNDGSQIIADEDHLWETETWNERAANGGRAAKLAAGWQPLGDGRSRQWKGRRFGVRTTAEIRDTLSSQHFIHNAKPLKTPEAELPIHPYLLGYWLGDGNTGSGVITVGGEDRQETLQRLARCTEDPADVYVMECDREREGGCKIRVVGLTTDLRAAGVLNNKHIPEIYKRASVRQRRELVAGLMDSDGWVRGSKTQASNNTCEFGVTVERLARDFYELVVSLGWKARFHKNRTHLYGRDCGEGFNVVFVSTSQACRLKRKAAKLNFGVAQRQRHTARKIVSVRPVPSVSVRCIEIDSPSHLYLAGEQMVPTHNSFGVSFIEFFLVFLKHYDALNLGGSELQADQVYQYLLAFIASDKFWEDQVRGETTQSKTTTTIGAWIRVLTASQKSVRSPHAGGRKPDGRLAGGVLVIDEEAEADADIVSAALPTINTARPSVNVRSSTFHNVEGSFADLIENHEEMGYTLYRWDIFDVAEGCDCPLAGMCSSEETCFREDHVEEYTDPDTGQTVEKLLHRAYCGGRAKFANGWIPMEEIETLWKRMKRNHGRWEVEAMGHQPSTSGYVIKDHVKWAANKTTESGPALFVPGFPVTVCVDWGTVHAGVEVWQEQMGDKHALLHADLIEGAGQSQIFGAILGYVNRYKNDFEEVAADIGGGGNYLNPKLREENNIPTRDVNFGEEKEIAAAALNIYNEAGALILPTEHADFHHQAKNWKRKNARIQKGNDHLMDAALCYFAKFVDRLSIRRIRVPPRSVSTAPHVRGDGTLQDRSNGIASATRMPRRPMARVSGRR